MTKFLLHKDKKIYKEKNQNEDVLVYMDSQVYKYRSWDWETKDEFQVWQFQKLAMWL